MNEQMRHNLQTGIVFGIILIFLFLIGFMNIIADLLIDFVEIKAFAGAGLSAKMVDMLLFLGLLGIWAGASAARRSEPDTWKNAVVNGLSAGLALGVLIGAFAFLIGTLQANGVRMVTYLAALLPATINLYLLEMPAASAAIFYFAFFTVTGLVGGGFARGVLRSSWRAKTTEWFKTQIHKLQQAALIQTLRGSPVARYVLYGVVLLAVFFIPRNLTSYWNYTLGTVGIYVLLGLGLNIVVGLAGLLDLGYVAFFAIGAYSVALLTAPVPHDIGMSFWLALLIGILLAALAGILLGIPVLRLRGDYLAIVTLGFGEIIRILSKSDLMTPFTGGPRGVTNIGGPTLFGQPFNSASDFVYLIVLAGLLIIFVTRRLQNSRVGRAWIAMREDETVAQAMGINTMRHKLLAFAIGAAFAGLGGAIFAARNQFTGPEDHNLMVSINVLALVIVGGMGSIPGVIAGAFVLKGLPEVLRDLENYRILAFGALLVVMMIWRPEGLIPSSRRRLEMHESEAPPEIPEAVDQEASS